MAIGGDPEEFGPYASPPCLLHELGPNYSGQPVGDRVVCANTSISSGAGRPVARLLPDRPLPPYAYLPGRFPHPVRDPRGHSFRAEILRSPQGRSMDPDALRWGADLFNHGFYWEAHEAWEELWRSYPHGGPDRDVLHGLILLAATGVKLRESKNDAARRHATRAAWYLRRVKQGSVAGLEATLGWSISDLATAATEAVITPRDHGRNAIVFDFTLGQAQASEH